MPFVTGIGSFGTPESFVNTRGLGVYSEFLSPRSVEMDT